ncbi:MAG: hypothetical protein AAF720_01640 [Pseudomonadota bacterium]
MVDLQGHIDYQDQSGNEVRLAFAVFHRIAHVENLHEATLNHYWAR